MPLPAARYAVVIAQLIAASTFTEQPSVIEAVVWSPHNPASGAVTGVIFNSNRKELIRPSPPFTRERDEEPPNP
jgi:hypothetical protein